MSASSDYSRFLVDITRGKGATQAATARANAQIWGGAVARLGDFASDAIKQYAVDKKAKKAEQQDQAFRDLFTRASQEFEAQQQPSMAELTQIPGTPPAVQTTPRQGMVLTGTEPDSMPSVPASMTQGTPPQQTFAGPDLKQARTPRSSPFPTPSEILNAVGPERGMPVINGIAALQKLSPNDDTEKRKSRLLAVWRGLDRLPKDQRAAAFPGIVQVISQAYGMDPSTVPAYDESTWDTLGAALGEKPTAATKVPTRVMKTMRDGVAGEEIVEDVPGGFYPTPTTTEAATNPTETSLALAAAKGDPAAQKALDLLKAQKGGSEGRNPTEASIAMEAAAGDPVARKALALLNQQRASTGQEPLVAIMRDGKPVLVRRSQAEGQTPASNREQGRNVTSGDAGRIADLDTSLNDLATLTKTIPAGSTGFRAQVGANLPAFVTQWTGRGASAKSKQAVIDRVKQVIGKALEGGVLRKEDEYKYEKILPTIKDVDSVVATKLKGLEAAIGQRRETTLDALEDANYDVSKYRTRQPASAVADPLGIR